MSMLKLTGGFQIIPEGNYVFKITKVVYKEEFGKMEVTMKTEDGLTHIERYALKDEKGNFREGAMNAFSYFARVALNDNQIDEIDPTDLVGCYFRGTVEHDIQPNKNDPSKTVTFVKIVDKESAEGFGNKTAAGEIDLDDLLG